MIYVDSSVFIAHLLSEDRRPSLDLWHESVASSRLLEIEAWNRLHAPAREDLGDALRALLDRLYLLEMDTVVLGRAIEPFPLPIRALDAIHLATADYLRTTGRDVSIATYDARMRGAAERMGFELYSLE
jgi:predicted nucleic acid-binding protein